MPLFDPKLPVQTRDGQPTLVIVTLMDGRIVAAIGPNEEKVIVYNSCGLSTPLTHYDRINIRLLFFSDENEHKDGDGLTGIQWPSPLALNGG